MFIYEGAKHSPSEQAAANLLQRAAETECGKAAQQGQWRKYVV